MFCNLYMIVLVALYGTFALQVRRGNTQCGGGEERQTRHQEANVEDEVDAEAIVLEERSEVRESNPFDDKSRRLNLDVLIVGDRSVGKSTLCLAWSHDARFTQAQRFFLDAHSNVQFLVHDFNGYQYDLEYDLPGLVRNARVIVLMFDITRPQTFASLLEWKQNLSKNSREGVIWILAANKIDHRERLGPQWLAEFRPLLDTEVKTKITIKKH